MCALRSVSGQADCFGNDASGQLAVPNADQIVKRGPYLHISAGLGHTCAVLTRDQSVVCWGGDGSGQSTPPTTLAGRAFVNVATGTAHTCAIDVNGTIACWGASALNQTNVDDVTAFTDLRCARHVLRHRSAMVRSSAGVITATASSLARPAWPPRPRRRMPARLRLMPPASTAGATARWYHPTAAPYHRPWRSSRHHLHRRHCRHHAIAPTLLLFAAHRHRAIRLAAIFGYLMLGGIGLFISVIMIIAGLGKKNEGQESQPSYSPPSAP